MDSLLGLAALAVLGWWLFKEGKHIGSRKGYHVGKMRAQLRGRRRRY